MPDKDYIYVLGIDGKPQMPTKRKRYIKKLLDAAKKDALYRILRKEHVSADICSHAVTLQKPLNALGIDKAAEFYINGRYNNELPYWDNLESIINEIYMEDKYRDVDCI